MDEIANPFTFPPSQYRLYTKRNLVLLDLLRSRSGTKLHDEISLEKQTQLLEDQGEPLDWTLPRLERPRADWIEQEGGYETFGDFWPVCVLHPPRSHLPPQVTHPVPSLVGLNRFRLNSSREE